MELEEKKRSVFLDLLKAISIVAVVLFHLDYLQYGYLGVDVFLVFGGFFVTKNVMERMETKDFSWRYFLQTYLVRLWPLVLLAGLCCLVVGYFVMLPDDYENLAESVVASNFFSNNILSCITTGNYWDVVNEYKPLMHLWYLGVYAQGSLFLLLIFALVKNVFGAKYLRRNVGIAFTVFSLMSFLLYCMPVFTHAQKFYYMPFRFFEFGMGAILVCLIPQISIRKEDTMFPFGCIVSATIIAVLFLYPQDLFLDRFRQTFVCIGAIFAIFFFLKEKPKFGRVVKTISILGQCSFSIFIWHQVCIAYIRYVLTSTFLITDLAILLTMLVPIVFISWKYMESRDGIFRNFFREYGLRACVFCCVITTMAGLYIYNNAGVVRDVPELDITQGNVHRHMHAEYCDRGYLFDKDFASENGKTKVLCIGDSFARDWINILLESNIREKIEISYIYPYSDEYIREREYRMDVADYIFFAISSNNFSGLPKYLLRDGLADKVYMIGNKSFGDNNGQIYRKRGTKKYFESTVDLSEAYLLQNEFLKRRYGEHYIDMIAPVQCEDVSIRVFTDDCKFISQDCRHLTKAGAKYYASRLDLDWMIKVQLKS